MRGIPLDPPHAVHGEGDQPQAGGGAKSRTVKQARALRRAMSLPETMLWQRLRRRAGSVKFRRQHPVAGYVLDFYCAAAKLAIEIDGEVHSRGDRPQRDAERDARLTALGLDVVRIPAAKVLRDPDAAAEAIIAAVLPLHHAAPRRGPPPHAAHGEDQGAS